jgi:hypothetical protein
MESNLSNHLTIVSLKLVKPVLTTPLQTFDNNQPESQPTKNIANFKEEIKRRITSIFEQQQVFWESRGWLLYTGLSVYESKSCFVFHTSTGLP